MAVPKTGQWCEAGLKNRTVVIPCWIGYELGSSDYITKPLDSSFVLSAVRKLLGAP